MRPYLTGEVNGWWQFDQGNIVDDADWSPIRVNGVFGSRDFNASGLSCQPNVVGSQIDVEETGIVGAVYESKNVIY